MSEAATPVNLTALLTTLLENARVAPAGRAAQTVYGSHDSVLRQTVLALVAGTRLGEHNSPPEATIQVLVGQVRLDGQGSSWELGVGDLMSIPLERHWVEALDDSVFLLTVRHG